MSETRVCINAEIRRLASKYFGKQSDGAVDLFTRELLAHPDLAHILALLERADKPGHDVAVVDRNATCFDKYGEDTPLMCNDISECPRSGWVKEY